MARYDDRRLVGVQAERVSNVSSSDFPGHYAGEDHPWNLKTFKKCVSRHCITARRIHTKSKDRTWKYKSRGYLNTPSSSTSLVSMHPLQMRSDE